MATLLFVEPRRRSRGGKGGSKSGDRLLNDVHDSLTKGNTDECGESEAEVCDDRRVVKVDASKTTGACNSPIESVFARVSDTLRESEGSSQRKGSLG